MKSSNDRLTDEARNMRQQAVVWADIYEHSHIGTEHYLLAMAMTEGSSAALILENLGLTQKDVRTAVGKFIADNYSKK